MVSSPLLHKQRRQHHEQRQKPHPLVSGAATTKTWIWRHPTTSFSTLSNEAQWAMHNKCFVRSDVASEQNNVQMCRWVVPWLRRKAQQGDADDCRVGKHHLTPRLSVPLLVQGCAKDHEPKSSNACLMTGCRRHRPTGASAPNNWTEMWWALPADIFQRQPTRHARGCTLVSTKPFQTV